MASPKHRELSVVLLASRMALGESQQGLGKAIRTARKTVGRWERGWSTPGRVTIGQIAALLLPIDPALAEELAAAAGETLASLGIARPDARPSPLLIDAIVCVAADAADMTPKMIRPALLAAFQRAKAAGLDVTAVVAGLSAKP